MNRQIKFRLWNGKEKKYWLNADLDEINLSNENIHLTNNFKLQLGGDQDFCLQEFTGLQDKNGKEIYEGDIVNLYFNNPSYSCEPEKARIVWSDFHNGWAIERLMFDSKSISTKFHRFKVLKSSFRVRFYPFTSLFISYSPVEIIGNIFENPELLS